MLSEFGERQRQELLRALEPGCFAACDVGSEAALLSIARSLKRLTDIVAERLPAPSSPPKLTRRY
jgi:hypothetical protein